MQTFFDTSAIELLHACPRPYLFLAGPAARNNDYAHSWRKEAVDFLTAVGFEGTAIIPMHEQQSQFTDSDEEWDARTEWEWAAMKLADKIIFWVPRKMPDLPALTTNLEFGMCCERYPDKVVLGYPDTAEATQWMRKRYMVVTGKTPTDTLITTLITAIRPQNGDDMWQRETNNAFYERLLLTLGKNKVTEFCGTSEEWDHVMQFAWHAFHLEQGRFYSTAEKAFEVAMGFVLAMSSPRAELPKRLIIAARDDILGITMAQLVKQKYPELFTDIKVVSTFKDTERECGNGFILYLHPHSEPLADAPVVGTCEYGIFDHVVYVGGGAGTKDLLDNIRQGVLSFAETIDGMNCVIKRLYDGDLHCQFKKWFFVDSYARSFWGLKLLSQSGGADNNELRFLGDGSVGMRGDDIAGGKKFSSYMSPKTYDALVAAVWGAARHALIRDDGILMLRCFHDGLCFPCGHGDVSREEYLNGDVEGTLVHPYRVHPHCRDSASRLIFVGNWYTKEEI